MLVECLGIMKPLLQLITDFRITPLDGSEKADISKGIMVTDPRGGTIAGPFYTEEKFAEFLNRQQSQK